MLGHITKWMCVTILAAIVLALCACSQRAAKISNYGDKYYGMASSDYYASLAPSSGGAVYGTGSLKSQEAIDDFGSKKYVWHEVTRGETLSQIAEEYNVPSKQIIRLNNIKNANNLEVGELIRIGEASFHVVERGETLKKIASDYGVNLEQLVAENDIKQIDNIKIGQKIFMPGAKTNSQKNEVSKIASNKHEGVENKKISSRKTNEVAEREEITKEESRENIKTTIAGAPKFSWPVKGKIIEKFGPKKGGIHNDGINIAAPEGTNVKASAEGTVVYAGNELKAYGNLVIIKHQNGWITAYAHNKEILVRKGQKVKRGETIAKVGASGNVSKPQLHFAVRKGREALNPANYL